MSVICFFALGFFLRCSSPTQKEDSQKSSAHGFETPKQVLSDSVPKRKFPILTNENAVPFLKKYFAKHPQRRVKMETRFGDVYFRLFDDTPLHTANFLMLVNRGYFDQTEFTRVVQGFVVQGGNNDKESEEIKRMLIGNYEIPAEFHPHHFHKRGALAMARNYEENPEKRSAAYNFYFVQGRTFNDPQLLAMEREHEMTIPPERRAYYMSTGGAPHLDGQHTVFGEIYLGLDVLDKLASVKTDQSDWPLEPLVMKMEVVDE